MIYIWDYELTFLFYLFSSNRITQMDESQSKVESAGILVTRKSAFCTSFDLYAPSGEQEHNISAFWNFYERVILGWRDSGYLSRLLTQS